MRHGLLLGLVGLVALVLRLADLPVRPMHADEANQAVKLGELLETGRYAFDPRDHHGPTLYYAALPVAWLRGQTTLASLNETTVRLTPVLFGVASVMLLWLLARPLGRWPAVAAAALFAVSPAAVYYSRYFVQETLLVAFTLGALVCAQRWWRTGLARWAVAAGACAGLMQATKISAPLFILAAGLALLAARPSRPAASRPARVLAIALVAALAFAALLYSSFGTHPAGLRDAFTAYGHAFARGTDDSGHDKPWWYYLSFFGVHRAGGVPWGEPAFAVLALAGLVVAVATRIKFLRWSAAYAVAVIVLFSLPAYKTPWHTVHFAPALALLGAGALTALPGWRSAALLLAAVLALQLWQVRLAVYRYPADQRNPFAYVHSSPDVLKYRPLAEAALARRPAGALRVISEEYWPLPWYFRGLPRTGYWNTAPADCDGALVITSTAQAAAVRARLHGRYRESFLGLRPGVICVLFTPEP
jgi:uncharacterized protein (TIGR03663 family)